jgi:hypothetical protein
MFVVAECDPVTFISSLARRGLMHHMAKTSPQVIATKQPVDRFFYSIAGLFTIF